MGRHRAQRSYGHRCKRLGADWYRLSWTVDRYYVDSRLRHPRTFQRDTDEAGAVRFCKRWQVEFPGKTDGQVD